jgi:tetratricopeptide (TPR) repeat protein
MILRILPLVALAIFAFAAVARAEDFDRVVMLSGQPVSGRIAEATRDKVVVQVLQVPKEVPVNEIKYIQYAGEPREMVEVRNDAASGHFEQVIEAIDKIPPPQRGSVEAIRQDIEFYTALANARLAAGGAGDAAAAGRALLAFINANKNSYHFYDANEAIADLLSSIGRYDQATTYYNELAAAPFPEFKLRAALGMGRALLAQGKTADALKHFETVLAADNKSKSAEGLIQTARIGKARCTIAQGNAASGIKMLEEIVDQIPPESIQALAIAYNALGDAYLASKQPKDALYAYLHVDILYNQSPEQHAEALYHLKSLWEQIGNLERAKEAGDTLKAKYASSRWNK